jgi:tRNA U34 2-thiouridine synthase MnmA/TrmU
MTKQHVKAVCLLSGGLDSALAARLMQEQGIDIVGVNFILPFGRPRRESAAEAVAESLGIELRTIRLGDDYLEVVKDPPHGYGSNVNPCIDCHIHMLRKAKELMSEIGADFVVTGEVLGQRPMSQRPDTLRLIERQSGLDGLLLRPLSALLMDPSIPEQEGWVRREDLLAISGRSRRELLRLAEIKGVRGYATPAGGCLLTDPAFAPKVRDLITHAMLTLHEAGRLGVGRHFRLDGGSKLIVGRNEDENNDLTETAEESDRVLTTPECPGPTGILIGDASAADEETAARIVARYSDGRLAGRVKIRIRSRAGERVEEVSPLDPEDVKTQML